MPPKRAGPARRNPPRSKRAKTGAAVASPVVAPVAAQAQAQAPRPSATWVIRAGHEDNAKVHEVMRKGNWKWLTDTAQELHPNKAACTLNRTTFARGVHNAVFELAFADQTYWVARVNLDAVNGEFGHSERVAMKSEYATMDVVRSRTSIPVPRVFKFSTNPQNPFGYIYTLMEALPGRVLRNQFAAAPTAENREKLARGLAKCVHELRQIEFSAGGRIWCGWNNDEKPEIMQDMLGNGPFGKVSEYFKAAVQDRIWSTINDYDEGDDEWSRWTTVTDIMACIIQDIIPSPRAEHKLLQYLRRTFTLSFVDLHYNNILVDDEYNITGVLDWSGAEAMPVQALLGLGDLELQDFTGDDEEANVLVLEFRKAFCNALRQLETPTPGRLTLTDLFESHLLDVIPGYFQDELDDAEAIALRALRLIYGEGTTPDNYRQRRKKGAGAGFPFLKEKPAE